MPEDRPAVTDPTGQIQQAKRALRGPLQAARRARSQAERAAARCAIGIHLTAALQTSGCVAAFLPLPSEPLDRDLLNRLAVRSRVLVPLVTGAWPLDWCALTDRTRAGRLGIEEPDGPPLGPEAIADADAVLVPALAVGPHGHRLGRGGGHYDRTLALRSRLRDTGQDVLIALVYDDEFPVEVPHDDLDRPVTAVVTPSRGLVRLTRP
jgi:5-formyltetrahydrofolate cyclo-ligase